MYRVKGGGVQTMQYCDHCLYRGVSEWIIQYIFLLQCYPGPGARCGYRPSPLYSLPTLQSGSPAITPKTENCGESIILLTEDKKLFLRLKN